MIRLIMYCMIVIVFYFIITLVWIGLENMILGYVKPSIFHDVIAITASVILAYFAFKRI